MAVSLKKPVKVDLSKPDLPRKLPEYTPIHLINEEETITKNDDRAPPKSNISSVAPKSNIPVVDCSGFDPSTMVSLKQISFKPVLKYAALGLLVLLLVAATIFIIVSTSEQISLDDISSASQSIFTFVFEVYKVVFSNPACLLIMGISALLTAIRLVQRTFRR